MTSALRQAQARHFDAHAPFTPASGMLRALGFRYSYILKDELISQALLEFSSRLGPRVLDLGCGRGILLDRLATSYRTQGFGVDVSRATLRQLRSKSLHPHQVVCSEGEHLPFPGGSFDAVLSLDVLEHVQIPERVLAEMLRVLRPEGVILCYAISRKNTLTLNWLLMKALDAFGVNHWAWNGHAPDRLVDPVQTRSYLEQSGCRIHYLRPFHAFFTVLFDQTILVLYWLAMRARLLEGDGDAQPTSPNPILKLASTLVRKLAKPLDLLDSPWVSRGLSNGFLVTATKPRAPGISPQTP